MVYIAQAIEVAGTVGTAVAHWIGGDAVMAREQIQFERVPEFAQIEDYINGADETTARQQILWLRDQLNQGAGGMFVAAERIGIDMGKVDPEHLAGLANLAPKMVAMLNTMLIHDAHRISIGTAALPPEDWHDRRNHDLTWTLDGATCRATMHVVPDFPT